MNTMECQTCHCTINTGTQSFIMNIVKGKEIATHQDAQDCIDALLKKVEEKKQKAVTFPVVRHYLKNSLVSTLHTDVENLLAAVDAAAVLIDKWYHGAGMTGRELEDWLALYNKKV